MITRKLASILLVLWIGISSGFSEPSRAQVEPPRPPEEAGVSQQAADPLAPEGGGASSAFSSGPSYDSGWVLIAPDQSVVLTHNLGGVTDDYVVAMDYWAEGVDGINQRYYGGADFGINPAPGHLVDDRVGAYWRSLTTSTITVYRRPEDTYAQKVRIRIWVDAYPNYNSGWVALTPDVSQTLTHNLGGSSDDYAVDMQYRSPGDGVNQRYYGGTDFGAKAFSGGAANDRVGAYWRTLTTSTIIVYRRPEDTYAPQARIRIWLRPRATYNSGWVNISQDQSITLSHNIGGSAQDYLVDVQYRSSTVDGVNHRYFGGADFGTLPAPGHSVDDRVGAYWRSLTNTSIVLYRRPQDTYVEQIRVRIFRFWTPTAPNFNSGWVSLTPDLSRSLTHNLGGSTDVYLVDLQYKSANSGINQRYYGGADFGANPAPGHLANDRVGAYWRTLTTSSITLYRRPEDDYAEQARVRIWVMPKPDYDTGWLALAVNVPQTFSHNLGGSYNDYLVDLQYRSAADGVNQRYYGGADFGNKPPYGSSENDRVGVYWRSLSTTSITIYRRPDDLYAEQARIRIWRMAQPDYDSNWLVLAQDVSQEPAHKLGGQADNYFLDLAQFDSDAANGYNHRHLGGADFGAVPPVGYSLDDRVGTYWRSLTSNSIVLYRRPQDGFADWMRVRLWDYNQKVYLPMTLKAP